MQEACSGAVISDAWDQSAVQAPPQGGAPQPATSEPCASSEQMLSAAPAETDIRPDMSEVCMTISQILGRTHGLHHNHLGC